MEKCRRSYRKRSHIRSLCCTGTGLFMIMLLLHRMYVNYTSNDEHENNFDKLKDIENEGQSSLLIVSRKEYVIADEQPNHSNHRNEVKDNKTMKHGNDTHKLRSNKTSSPTNGDESQLMYEHDPTIEENAVAESYKWHINIGRTTKCSEGNPAKYAVLLRSHRTGSHTVGNIFYRYGDFNNLMFALPKVSDFQHYWPLRFHHTRVDKTLLDKMPPNFLINTARNSRIKIKSFLSSETYKIAILRDPVFHFQSVYESIGMRHLMMKHISNATGRLEDFLKNPKDNIDAIVNKTNMFDPVFYLLHNGQLFDFGYNMNEYTKGIDVKFIIRELDEYIDLVLISEYMDESLILLQRMLCWQLSDIVYIKKRERKHHENISADNRRAINEWNKQDKMLYDHFNKSFWIKVSEQDKSFWQDVKMLKEMNVNVKDACANETKNESEKMKPAEDGGENLSSLLNFFNLTRAEKGKNPPQQVAFRNEEEITYQIKENIDSSYKHICERLLLTEKEYVDFLKLKQKTFLQQKENEINSRLYFHNATEGRFYYEFINFVMRNETSKGVRSNEENEEPKEITFGTSHTD